MSDVNATPLDEALYRLVVFPFGPNRLMVHSFRGKEQLSGLYAFDLVVTAADTGESDIERLALGQRAVLLLRTGKAPRAFHGVIAAVRQLGTRSSHGSLQYQMRLVPRLWLLKHRRRSRIFQHMRLDQILATVLKEFGIESRFDLHREYPVREYCTQYEETDYRFIQRLVGESGLFYRYEQQSDLVEPALNAAVAMIGDVPRIASSSRESAILGKLFGGETIFFADDTEAYVPLYQDADRSSSPTLYYVLQRGTSTASHQEITRFEPIKRVRANAATYREYDPTRPLAIITQHERADEDEKKGFELDTPALELYDHHAAFLFSKWRHAEQEPSLMLRQERRNAQAVDGESTCSALAPGSRFALEDHPIHDLNRDYAVTTVEHEGWTTPSAEHRELYRNRFSCVPRDVLFCPKRPERKNVSVTLTAIVVGPEGSEIHTDTMGQILVQFHWDRDGRKDERSSCWIRTMQALGGPGWGTQWIPRVGMEVVVTFEGGDPDKPMVLGCLYNGTHPPSFDLPKDKTKSGFRTQSSPGGGGFNELSFEDRKGLEQVYLHAARDLEEDIVRDHSLRIGSDQEIRVEGNQKLLVCGERSETTLGGETHIIEGDQTQRIQKNRVLHVDGDTAESIKGNHSLKVEGNAFTSVHGDISQSVQGDLTLSIDGDHSVTIGKDGHDVRSDMHVHGALTVSTTGPLKIKSTESILLQCGGSVIELKPDGLLIQAGTLIIAGTEKVSVAGNGPALHLGDEAELVAKKLSLFSEGASLELERNAALNGEQVKINCEKGKPKKREGEDKKQETQNLKLALKDYDFKPYANKQYRLVVDGSVYEGKTGGDGLVEQKVPKEAESGQLTLWVDEYPTGRKRQYQLKFGEATPAETPKGALSRLKNLGYYFGVVGDEMTESAKDALREFQKDHTLEPNGKLDDATITKLKDAHGH